MTCCSRSGNICTTVTGFPEVKLTPYIGAVVLNVDLQSLEGVAGVVSHCDIEALSFDIPSIESFLFLLLSLPIEELEFEFDVAKVALIAFSDAVNKLRMNNIFQIIQFKYKHDIK